MSELLYAVERAPAPKAAHRLPGPKGRCGGVSAGWIEFWLSQGWTNGMVAERCGVSHASVSHFCRKNGIVPARERKRLQLVTHEFPSRATSSPHGAGASETGIRVLGSAPFICGEVSP